MLLTKTPLAQMTYSHQESIDVGMVTVLCFWVLGEECVEQEKEGKEKINKTDKTTPSTPAQVLPSLTKHKLKNTIGRIQGQGDSCQRKVEP